VELSELEKLQNFEPIVLAVCDVTYIIVCWLWQAIS